MSTPTNPADAAREAARQDNGQFGTQHRAEAGDIELTDTASAQAVELPADLARLRFLVDDLDERNPHHNGSMLPHHSAGDCGKCVEGRAYDDVRALIDDHDPEFEVMHHLTRISSEVSRLRAENHEMPCSGNMQPHASASDCRRCLREGALRKVAHKLNDARAAVDQRPDFGSVDRQWKDACEEYATRYAPALPTLDHHLDGYDHNHVVPAGELAIGDRLVNDSIVTGTRVDPDTGELQVFLDGRNDTPISLDADDPMLVHDARVDLTDPDWFEFEAHRVTEMTFQSRYPNGAPDQASYDEVAIEVRRSLTRVMQPTNISPLHNDDVRAANGRAKVGDDVIFSQPMWGDTSYRVIGKVPRVDILGHDGTGVVWGETGEVEYVLKDLYTGHQSTSNLRGHGYRRIPAPGDTGLGAQTIAAGNRPVG